MERNFLDKKNPVAEAVWNAIFWIRKTPNAEAHMDPMKSGCRKKLLFPGCQVGSIVFNASFWRFSKTV
ncbi:MAG: hypothetical protein HGA31_01060 [Candidatus Moranbacteria bacterium]|nr:hypothetical protein [Candidatus Moranbacteria bacterium]